jgi:hypothetical protein
VRRETEDIEVVILTGDHDPGEDHEGGADVAEPPSLARRSAAAVAVAVALVVLAVLGPFGDGRAVDEAAGPPTSEPEPAPCPTPDTRRLWCSFVPDGTCCPVDGSTDRTDADGSSREPAPPAPPSQPGPSGSPGA